MDEAQRNRRPPVMSLGRLLVVENRARLGSSLLGMLERERYEAEHVASTEEARASSAERSPRLILVSLDLMDSDDPEAWREGAPPPLAEIPRVVIAGASDRALLRRILSSSSMNRDVLVHPIEPVTMVAAVRVLLGDGGARSFNRAPMWLPLPEAQHGFLVDLSERGIGLQLPYPIDRNTPIEISSPIWEEIGIERPIGRVSYCAPVNRLSRASRYRVGVLIVGLSGAEQRLIRQWLFRSQARRLR